MKKVFLVFLSALLLVGCGRANKQGDPVNNQNDPTPNNQNDPTPNNPVSNNLIKEVEIAEIFTSDAAIVVNGVEHKVKYIVSGTEYYYENPNLDSVDVRVTVELDGKIVLKNIAFDSCKLPLDPSEVTKNIALTTVHGNILITFNIDYVGKMNLERYESLYVLDTKGNILINEDHLGGTYYENGKTVEFLVVDGNSITLNDAVGGIRKYTLKNGKYEKTTLTKPSNWTPCCGL